MHCSSDVSINKNDNHTRSALLFCLKKYFLIFRQYYINV
nr:MAG TPA: hypothetical protein [Caudoviricetes sp.]